MKAALISLAILATVPARASVLFADNFTSGANAAWGNESGSWRALNGRYDAAIPGNGETHPATYSSVTTLPALKNFTVRATVLKLNDGGIWLRSSYGPSGTSGVLLVTGGVHGSFNGFYWHVVHNGSYSAPLNQVTVPGIQGTNQNLRIVVKGSTYSLYLGASTTPVTTLTTSDFASGSVALYDFSPNSGASSPRGQMFDNIKIIGP